jgi:acyl-CoA thioesterase FadM
MSLLLRLFLVVVAAAFRPRLDVADDSRLTMIVLPNDLDLNLHMNNGRYLTVLDLGRLDFLLRAGLAPVLVRKRWQPLIGGTLIRYRFGLRAFQRYKIITRVLCWDDKWFYFEQLLITNTGLLITNTGIASIALSKALLRHRTGTVDPAGVLAVVDMERPSPAMPASVACWARAEESLHIEDEVKS